MIYLNSAATSARRPSCVIEAVTAALQGMGSSSRGAAETDLSAARVVAEARWEVARFFGFDHPERVVFTANATQALNTAILGTVRPGDHVVATAYEHNSVLRPLNYLAREHGVRLDIVPVARDGSLDMADVERLVTPGTRLVAISHASNLTGALLPVAEVARIAHAAGAVVLVDAAQTAGAYPVDMAELGADLLAFTGHKALMGPTGTGGLLVGADMQVRPLLHGGTGVASSLPDQPDTYPEHLEAGTLNTCGIAGLAAAVRFVAQQGVEAIRAREAALRERFIAGVSGACVAGWLRGDAHACCDGDTGADPLGIRILGSHDGMEHVATVALAIDGLDAARVADILATDYGIATRAGLHCAPLAHAALGTREQGAVRFSFCFYTTEDEVDAAARAVIAIAVAAREGES